MANFPDVTEMANNRLKDVRKRLQSQLPTDQQLVKEWWRIKQNRFRKQLSKTEHNKSANQKSIPEQTTDWSKYRMELLPQVPSLQELRDRWWRKKTVNLMKKIVSEDSDRPSKARQLCIYTFLVRLVSCPHWNCYKLRFNIVVLVIFNLILVFWALD